VRIPLTGRNSDWAVPAGWNKSGSRGEKDMVAEARGEERGGTDKVGSENDVLWKTVYGKYDQQSRIYFLGMVVV